MVGSKVFLLLAATLLLASGTADAVAPRFPVHFRVDFNETTKLVFTRQTNGVWYYDGGNGAERLDRANGRGDRYCMSLHPLTDTPCTHLVAGGTRYLVFPQLKECCACCSAEQGCGALTPAWLDGADFLGIVPLFGRPAYKWRKAGLQNNYYYASADDRQVPLELDQAPNDFMTFKPDTFTTAALPGGTFDVPDYCTDKCPLASLCSVAGLGRAGSAKDSMASGIMRNIMPRENA